MTDPSPTPAQVVVITGASGGIGRATALAFARDGARLVLVSRSAEALEEVAAECKAAGGEALVIAADVADDVAMEKAAGVAVERFGRIDVWVEAAAVLIAGPFGSESVDEIRRLVDTNVMGSVLGARAALNVFREQGSGVLILMGSLLGLVTNPLAPLYAMSKSAIRGLALNLRQAVAAYPNIHVSVILPGPVDTTLFQRAANHTGRQLRAIPPPVAPERVAATIVRCARHPKRQATAGAVARAVLVAHRLSPRLTEWAVARYSAPGLVRRNREEDSSGFLFDTPAGGLLRSQWRHGELRRRLGARMGARR